MVLRVVDCMYCLFSFRSVVFCVGLVCTNGWLLITCWRYLVVYCFASLVCVVRLFVVCWLLGCLLFSVFVWVC